MVARLIPAHAGKTCSLPPRSRSTRAHPRSRGENLSAPCTCLPNQGSSPLTRGKRDGGRIMKVVHGLIPAHAGKTGRRRDSRPQPRAHPRSRGENPWMARSRRCVHGSSPLTRGKRQRAWQACTWPGLIPAHAGKTSRVCLGDPRGAAHPRSRGENSVRWSPTARSAGSSPLTRGKRSHHGGHDKRCGLIPAHAGKTVIPSDTTSGHPAHPRSRGENPLT